MMAAQGVREASGHPPATEHGPAVARYTVCYQPVEQLIQRRQVLLDDGLGGPRQVGPAQGDFLQHIDDMIVWLSRQQEAVARRPTELNPITALGCFSFWFL